MSILPWLYNCAKNGTKKPISLFNRSVQWLITQNRGHIAISNKVLSVLSQLKVMSAYNLVFIPSQKPGLLHCTFSFIHKMTLKLSNMWFYVFSKLNDSLTAVSAIPYKRHIVLPENMTKPGRSWHSPADQSPSPALISELPIQTYM